MDPAALVALAGLAYVVFGRKKAPPPDEPPGVSGRGAGAGAQEGATYDDAQRVGDQIVERGQYVDGQTVEVELAVPYAMYFGRASSYTIWNPMGDGKNAGRAPGQSVSWGTSGPLVGTVPFTDTEPFPDVVYSTYRTRGQRGERFSGMVSIGDNPRWLPRATSLHRALTETGGNGAVPGFNGAVPDGPHAPGDEANRYGTKQRAEVQGIQTPWGPMALARDTTNFSAWTLANHDAPNVSFRLFIGAKSWTAARIQPGPDGAPRAIHLSLTETRRRLAWVPPGALGADPSTDRTARANIPSTAAPWTVAPFAGWGRMVARREGMEPIPALVPTSRGYRWRNGFVGLDADLRFNGWLRGAPAHEHGYMPDGDIMATGRGVLPVARVDGTDFVPESLNGEYTFGPNGRRRTSFYLTRMVPASYRGGWSDGAPGTTPAGVVSSWPKVPFPLDAPVQRKAIEAKGYRQHFPTE
jgi:hypothetical protein